MLLGLMSDANWPIRAIAAALFLVGAFGIFVSYVVTPAFGFIGPKLIQSSLRVRLSVEVFFRLVMLGLAVYCGPILYNMGLDAYNLTQRGYPISTEAIVSY